MSLIKSLIQRLLDSRTTPEEAAHSAMPQENQVINYGSTTENPGSWTTILSFTAPKDGYAKAVVVGTGKNSAELYCGNMRVSAFAPVDNASINVVMPVRKGASVGLVSTVFKSAALYFIPSIGGGYNRIVRRALSCLRPSFNFSQRNSCKTSLSGLAAKQCLAIQQSELSTHLNAHRVSTLLRVTGMSLFTPVAMNGRKSGMETEASLSPQRVLPTSAFKCLSLKAPKLGMSFRTPWPTELKKRPLSLFQQSERNALTGGALC